MNKKFINLAAPILITGETGTGKSYLAKKIFEQSNIFKEKFLTVHLASLKDDLIESELFGYKRGAFTGASEGQNGYLKDVGSGTLFLDEIGELSCESQKKLLYLLEEKKFTPLGSTTALDFKGRIIMATNKPLAKMVEEGTFREDLFYRIKTFEIKLEPLLEKQNVLEDLIQVHFSKLKKTHQKNDYKLTTLALNFLKEKEWKGNLRELRNYLEYAILMSENKLIEVSDFPVDTNATISGKISFLAQFPDDYNQSLELFEKMYLASMFERHSGKVNETARRIGISKTTLIHKAKKYQINTLKIRAEASVLAA